MKRSLWIAFLLGCLTGCGPSVPAPIYVGHVSDRSRLSGAADTAELGMRLALAELTRDGAPLSEGIGGRAVQIRHTDTRGNLDAYESEAVRLVSINKCIALFGGYTAQEVEKLDRGQVPLLTYCGFPVVGASSQVYYLGMMPARQGAVLAKVLAENTAATRLAIVLDERRADCAALSASFQKAWPSARAGELAPAEAFVVRFGKDAKWTEIVEKTRPHNPDAILFAGQVQDFNDWHKALRKTKVAAEAQLIFAGLDGDQRDFDLGGNATTVLLATAFPVDAANAKAAAFRKAYHDAFQLEPDVHAALAYDGFRVFAEALKRTAPLNTQERLREELQKTKDFDAATGPLTILPDRQTQRPLSVLRWQAGKLTAVKTFAVGD